MSINWKRILAFLLVLLMTVTFAQADEEVSFSVIGSDGEEEMEQYPDDGDAAKAERYQKALEELANNQITEAINDFGGIGKYRNAPRYASYAQARLLYLRQNPQKAKTAFESLGDFSDSAFCAKLCEAMGVHRFMQDGKFGYMDAEANVVIEPSFDWAERVFREESRCSGDTSTALLPVAMVFNGSTTVEDGDLAPLSGKYGLIRRDGKLIVPVEYDEILWTQGGVAAVRKGTSVTILDLISGKTVGEIYQDALEPSEGFCAVCSGGKWGYLKLSTGKLLSGYDWDEAQSFSEGLAGVTKNKKAGYINASGTVVIELSYSDVQPFSEGLGAVYQSKKWGFVDTEGNVVIKPSYKAVGSFVGGVCPVKKSKYGVIDREENIIIPFKYDEITSADTVYGRLWARTNKLWGIYNTAGEMLITTSFASYTPFGNEGLSRVSYRGLYGYVDASGNLRVQLEYSAASAFSGAVGGVLSDTHTVTYLNRNNLGFDVESDVPTEVLCGFIEGRQLGDTTVSYKLYTISGKEITDWSK